MIVTKKELIKHIRRIIRKEDDIYTNLYVEKFGRAWRIEFTMHPRTKKPWEMEFYYISEKATYLETEKIFWQEYHNTPNRFSFNDAIRTVYEFVKKYEYIGNYEDFEIVPSMTYNQKVDHVYNRLANLCLESLFHVKH